MNQIKLSNMKITYIILLLMSFLGAINDQNESKINNPNFEKTLLNNRKRKLQEDNYIIVIYNEDVEYSSGFQNYKRETMNYYISSIRSLKTRRIYNIFIIYYYNIIILL